MPTGLGLRPVAKAPDEPPNPTGYAPPLDSTWRSGQPRRCTGHGTVAAGGSRIRTGRTAELSQDVDGDVALHPSPQLPAGDPALEPWRAGRLQPLLHVLDDVHRRRPADPGQQRPRQWVPVLDRPRRGGPVRASPGGLLIITSAYTRQKHRAAPGARLLIHRFITFDRLHPPRAPRRAHHEPPACYWLVCRSLTTRDTPMVWLTICSKARFSTVDRTTPISLTLPF